jgi:hypothetical protein
MDSFGAIRGVGNSRTLVKVVGFVLAALMFGYSFEVLSFRIRLS